MSTAQRWLAGLLMAWMGMSPAFAADDPAAADWAMLARFQADNARLGAPAKGEQRVVFMGDSITEFWSKGAANVFARPGYVNRGISGQTTPQMLLRFRQDVIALKPAVVVILAGTNDIAGNSGPATLETISGNIASMAELARVHGIRVVLCALVPANRYYWSPEQRPAPRVAELNQWIRAYAAREHLGFVDYFSPMVDAEQGLLKTYSDDGVHPNEAGYTVMRPLVEQAIAAALGR